MKGIKKYIALHLSIMVFSFTGVFSKMASSALNENGLHSLRFYIFLGLMLLNCGIYAIAWQRVIKQLDLSIAFAHRSVYLIWSQIWAFLIFNETLTARNMLGLAVTLLGVMIVHLSDAKAMKKEERT